jgi:hypothetical protein
MYGKDIQSTIPCDHGESVMSAEHADGVAQIAEAIGQLGGVVADALGGSTATGLADQASDIDLHVYWLEPLAPAAERAEHLAGMADPGSLRVGLISWGLEDHLAVAGRPLDLIYRHWGGVRDEVERAYDPGLLSPGFTTAVLYSVACDRPLYDPSGELGAARARLHRTFPEATRAVLLRHDSPLLGFHLQLLRQAQGRDDLLFAQHLRAKLQMLFFDVLFALNRLYHPGEKRLLEHARRCPIRPVGCAARWGRVARLAADDPSLVAELGALVGELGDLVRACGAVEIPDEPL